MCFTFCKKMKTLTIILMFAFAVPAFGTDEAGVRFHERNQQGILLENVSKSMIFVYYVCSLDFRVTSSLNNQEYETILSEKTDPESFANNNIQAGLSKTHGFFVGAGGIFKVNYPPGYTNTTFPNGVRIRLRYREASAEDDDKILLSNSKSIDIETSAITKIQAEQAAPRNR